jgi:gluconolactonase
VNPIPDRLCITGMNAPIFFPADAHEGPVWVAQQQRLYFTTTTHLDANPLVSIVYLDFTDQPNDGPGWRPDPTKILPQVWLADANMANGMALDFGGNHLLVAEQGGFYLPARIQRYSLDDQTAETLVDNFQGMPFNSPNKVLPSRRGHLLFSDPDYGFRQHFRPPSEMEPALYTLTRGGMITSFDCGLEMPHGLALCPDEKTLFVTDTSYDGAHRTLKLEHRRRSVWAFGFEANTGQITGPGRCCFSVDEGIPDGAIISDNRLLVAGGDGVYVADTLGRLLGKISTGPDVAVNLCTTEDEKHLFVTIDRGVLLFPNWSDGVKPI